MTGAGSHSNIQSAGVLPAKSLLRRKRDASSTSEEERKGGEEDLLIFDSNYLESCHQHFDPAFSC
eukprot:7606576-Pyramimonas_sp.AAC.1